MNTRTHIEKFWSLAQAGKSAALDINTKTGELAVRCTISASGDEGNGTPPACMTSEWTRVVSSSKGVITRGSEA